MSSSMLISLAQRFHAFSGSSLKTLTLPTSGASSDVAGSVEVVQEPAASQMIAQFLGTAPDAVVTPPLDAYGEPVTVPSTVPSSATSAPTSGTGAGTTSPTTTVPGQGPFNPTPC